MKIVRFDTIESLQMSFGLVPKVLIPLMWLSLCTNSLEWLMYMRWNSETSSSLHALKLSVLIMMDGVTLSSMTKSKVSVFALGTMAVEIFPIRISKPSTDTLQLLLSLVYFWNSAEITLVRIYLPIWFVAWKLRGYDKSQTHVETNGGVGLDTNNLGDSSCRRTRDKVAQKVLLAFSAKDDFYIHNSNYRLFLWS